MTEPAWLRASRHHDNRLHEILGLPTTVNWTADAELRAPLDGPATFTISIMLTAEQLAAIAKLAGTP